MGLTYGVALWTTLVVSVRPPGLSASTSDVAASGSGLTLLELAIVCPCGIRNAISQILSLHALRLRVRTQLLGRLKGSIYGFSSGAVGAGSAFKRQVCVGYHHQLILLPLRWSYLICVCQAPTSSQSKMVFSQGRQSWPCYGWRLDLPKRQTNHQHPFSLIDPQT